MGTTITIFYVIGQIVMIAMAILLIRYIIIKSRDNTTNNFSQVLNYIFALVKLKDQYLAYGYEAETKELDEQIKELLKKIEL